MKEIKFNKNSKKKLKSYDRIDLLNPKKKNFFFYIRYKIFYKFI